MHAMWLVCDRGSWLHRRPTIGAATRSSGGTRRSDSGFRAQAGPAQQLGAFGHLVAHRVTAVPATTPSRGAVMVCSIFIASITASAWPR
jgi:hypothetical protein